MKGLELIFNTETQEWEERTEPFTTIEVETEKDFEFLKEAIEKQKPQKPLSETEWYGNGKCPRCAAVFLDKSTNYCGNCGQRLDWRLDERKTTKENDDYEGKDYSGLVEDD